MNVIILGDFHQFPQGARPIRDALYYPSSAKIDSLGSQNGRVIYGEYNSCYIKRVSDLVWHNFLQHLRQVRWMPVQSTHSNNSIVYNWEEFIPGCRFCKRALEWCSTSYTTPCGLGSVEQRSTQENISRNWTVHFCLHSRRYYQRTINRNAGKIYTASSPREKKTNRGSHTSKDLPYQIEIPIGIKVMVTDNVETDLDINAAVQPVAKLSTLFFILTNLQSTEIMLSLSWSTYHHISSSNWREQAWGLQNLKDWKTVKYQLNRHWQLTVLN